jgi:hypothetical protein
MVEASVLARLFGMRLLTLDANVIVSRTQVMRLSPVPYDAPVRSSGEAAPAPPERSRAIGARLADAERLIDEGAATLAASQSTRPLRDEEPKTGSTTRWRRESG